MKRTCAGILVLAGAAVAVALAPEKKPYPYPVAYKLGFDYREESVKEEAWQTSLAARAPFGPAAAGGGMSLPRFWPRYPDTESGALACWRERGKDVPILYLEKGRGNGTRAEQEELAREGWVAGYLDSVRRQARGPATLAPRRPPWALSGPSSSSFFRSAHLLPASKSDSGSSRPLQ
jgi:hypothetical protein